MTIKLMRDCRPETGIIFTAAPFGIKDGFDFDVFYTNVIVPACADAGMKAIRADELYGKGDITETAWHGIQRASIVLVDFSAKSTNVAAEFALALVLGKRIVVLCQDEQDIPSDVRGHYKYIRYGVDYLSVERLKQELAKELPAILEQSSAEMMLMPMAPGGTTPVTGEVVVAEKEYVIVVTDDRRKVVLNAADVDYRYVVTDMAKKFPVGTRVQGAFEVDLTGESKYTLTAGKTNPWPGLESQFPPGTEFTGRVDRIMNGMGVFVHVANGVNGLVPEHKLAGRKVHEGDKVEVAITSMDVERRRIGLRLDRVAANLRGGQLIGGELPSTQPTTAQPKVGEKVYAAVVKAMPEADHKGGFIILETEEDKPQRLFLHCTKMLPELREDLNAGKVQVDELIYVEIERVDASRNKICVREVSDPQVEADGMVAAAA
jgi:small subunit ribosomal protein S1